eukprot:TRINITY_DN4167_c0_g1_i4.p1 TRINITY_DN4167_c0_g1~~TRINITY_DN4167_c0_g1_i4.p1  ORF type:complete len:521 (-),score=177.13 TRINITY_DN4167_c0_g1_i4:117-1679(-)
MCIRDRFVSEDCDKLAVGMADGSLETWSVSAKRQVQQQPATQDAVCVLRRSPNNASLAVGRHNGAIDLLHLTQGIVWAVLDPADEDSPPVQCLLWSADSALLASAAGNCIALWEASSGRCVQTVEVTVRQDGARSRDKPVPGVASMSLSMDGRLLAAAVECDICLFELGSHRLTPSVSLRRAHNHDVCSVLLCQDAMVSSATDELRSWKLPALLSELQRADLRGLEYKSEEAAEAQRQVEHKADTLAEAELDCETCEARQEEKMEQLCLRQGELEAATEHEAMGTAEHQKARAALEQLRGPHMSLQELLESEVAAAEEDKVAMKAHNEELARFKKDHSLLRKAVEAGEATDEELETAERRRKQIDGDLTARMKIAEHRRKYLKKVRSDATKAKREFERHSEAAAKSEQQAAEAVAALHTARHELGLAVEQERVASQHIAKSAKRLLALKIQAEKRYEEHRCAQAQGELNQEQRSFDTDLQALCLSDDHRGFKGSEHPVTLAGGLHGVVVANGPRLFSRLS